MNDGALKTIMWMAPEAAISLNLLGGDYGEPFTRDPQPVFADVVNGYVSLEAAKERYGVVVRLPEHYAIDCKPT